MRRRIRAALVVTAVVTVSAAGALATASTENGTTPAAAPTRRVTTLPLMGTPTVTDLGLTGTGTDLLLAGGRVWVGVGDEVRVFSLTGEALGTVPGMTGVRDLVASADGLAVYAALSGAAEVAALDTATMTRTGGWSTTACPVHLALTSLDRLFYSHGCGGGPVGTASIDLVDGSNDPTGVPGSGTVPPLVAAGDATVATATAESPSTLVTYEAHADGTLTGLASATTARARDLAVSTDGQWLLTTGYDSDEGSGSVVERYATADLATPVASDLTADPAAVAFSLDGTLFAGGLESSAAGMVRVYESDAGAVVSHSAVHQACCGTVNPWIVPGTLQFTDDGQRLVALATTTATPAHLALVTATAGPVTGSTLAASATSPSAYGGKVAVAQSSPGRGQAPVRLTVTTADATTTARATTDAGGRATVRAGARTTGTVTVTVLPDETHTAATKTVRFTVPAKVTLTLTGAYRTTRGVRYYRRASKVHGLVTFTPARAGVKVTVVLEKRRRNGTWATASSAPLRTAAGGTVPVTVSRVTAGARYRFRVAWPGDATNAAAPTAVSPAWTVA